MLLHSPTHYLLYRVSIEDTYIIKKAHITTGHGGRDRMLKHLGVKYASITKDEVELFKSHCKEKRTRPRTKSVVVKPVLTRKFNSRGQVDLIYMQSSQQGQFRWAIVYQCHLTKFIRPLTTRNRGRLPTFGHIPSLQCSSHTTEWQRIWIHCQSHDRVERTVAISHYGTWESQTFRQGSIEGGNSDIKDKLIAWMSDNNTQEWTVGLKFIQEQKKLSPWWDKPNTVQGSLWRWS